MWSAAKSYFDDNIEDIYPEKLSRIASESDQRSIMSTIYKRTQTYLESLGISHVTLFRGVHQRNSYTGGNVVNWVGNAVESWTASIGITSTFTGSNDYRLAVAIKVPIKSIFSTAVTGFGCLLEGEFLIFGNLPGMTARVVGGGANYGAGDVISAYEDHSLDIV